MGFNSEEREKQQDVVINIEIHYPASLSAQTDNVNDALNYKVITKKVIQHVEEGRFLLLEKLVADILEISGEHPWVATAKSRGTMDNQSSTQTTALGGCFKLNPHTRAEFLG
nr:FolB domain-containing protein [Shewanella mesophila]